MKFHDVHWSPYLWNKYFYSQTFNYLWPFCQGSKFIGQWRSEYAFPLSTIVRWYSSSYFTRLDRLSSTVVVLSTQYLWTVYSTVYCDRSRALQIMAATPDQRQSLVEQAQDELVCPICTDFFVRPRSLICLHSFCENCLVQLWRVSGEQETVICPECRAKSSLSDQGVAGKLLSINRVKSISLESYSLEIWWLGCIFVVWIK